MVALAHYLKQKSLNEIKDKKEGQNSSIIIFLQKEQK